MPSFPRDGDSDEASDEMQTHRYPTLGDEDDEHLDPDDLHPADAEPPTQEARPRHVREREREQHRDHEPEPSVIIAPQPPPTPSPVVAPQPIQVGPDHWLTGFHFRRSRTYSFVVDAHNRPLEIGAGRFSRVFLGHERWVESLTDVQRPVVIKMMHRGLDEVDATRFRMEKALLEHVQGHPNIVEILGSGSSSDPRLPSMIQDQCEGDFLILEKLDCSLEERIRGARPDPHSRDNLIVLDMHDRLLRTLEYMVPVAGAVEYAHLVRNVCHRDINPANVLLRLPPPNLLGTPVQVRLADFSAAKMDLQSGLTRMQMRGVPGTMFFQSPEQEANVLELLVSVQRGSMEVEYHDDFYVAAGNNDTFTIFNRPDEYPIVQIDRTHKRIYLKVPYQGRSERNTRAYIQRSVGRPADLYALGALLYYLISGATQNPKALFDAIHQFVEYEQPHEQNTVEAYLDHEYGMIENLARQHPNAPDRTYGFPHFFDGNGELIHFSIMAIILRCMVRNKVDSYCQAWDLETTGISAMVRDLTNLYQLYGITNSIPSGVPLGMPQRQRRDVAIGRGVVDSVLSVFRKR